jgi:class 3 adenylate cyclase
MERLARWGWQRLGRAYLPVYFALELLSALTFALGTVALLSLYQEMTAAEFAHIVLVAWACVAVAMTIGIIVGRPQARPLLEWIRGARGRDGAADAWRAAVALPVEIVMRSLWLPVVVVAIPVSAFVTISLALPWYAELIVLAAAAVAIAYSAVFHFFVSEIAFRPVVQDIASNLPSEFSGAGAGVPLRVKLLGTLPLINVVTGIVVSGLSARGPASLSDLGVDVIVALLVSFTLSLEITLLITKSILAPVRDLLAVTDRVKEGDLSARVPVVSDDEIGRLSRSFNKMMAGLEEREALREAFGSYVNPDVADRVLAEGVNLEGEDLEVTVVFVDIRNFTAFAERASARETVAHLNDFFGLAVPILAAHGGHANKFIGDGVMGVFGAPERLPDHARRAVDAACELAAAVDERYGPELRIGVGINSGPVSAGSVGGGGRLEFTVIGDTVNVAARVERLTRETGDTVLLTEATRALLHGSGVELESRGEVPIRGRSHTVPVYAPRSDYGVTGQESAHPAELRR